MRRFKKTTAVVLGLELNGLSVARSLGRAGVQVLGVDSDFEQVTALSKYLVARIKTEDIRGSSVIDTLVRLAGDGRPYILIPTMESTVSILSEARDDLPENIVLRLPDKEMTRSLLHKGAFRKLCLSKKLLTPAYAVVNNREELEKALNEIRFPLVMKGTLKKMGAGPKASLVENRHEAFDAYETQGKGEMILEEWIPGRDDDVYFCLQAYGANSELLASFMGRKIRQWPPLVGGTASAEPVDLPELEADTTRFFKDVDFKGIGSMEYKYDSRDGRYYAIEPTVGRTDFQSGIAPANRVNIPLAAVAEMAGMRYEVKKQKIRVKWVNPIGDAQSAEYYMKRGELTRSEWKRSLAGPRVSTLFAFDDPGPWVSEIFRRIKARLARRFKR